MCLRARVHLCTGRLEVQLRWKAQSARRVVRSVEEAACPARREALVSVAGASWVVGHHAHCFSSIVQLTEDTGPEGWSTCPQAQAEGQSTSPLHRSLALPVGKEELRPGRGRPSLVSVALCMSSLPHPFFFPKNKLMERFFFPFVTQVTES